MTLSLDIPEQAAQTLLSAYGENLPRAVLESLAIEGYRSGRLSRYQVQSLLGLDNRWDTEKWLGAHGVHWNYTVEDLDADRDTLKRLDQQVDR